MVYSKLFPTNHSPSDIVVLHQTPSCYCCYLASWGLAKVKPTAPVWMWEMSTLDNTDMGTFKFAGVCLFSPGNGLPHPARRRPCRVCCLWLGWCASRCQRVLFPRGPGGLPKPAVTAAMRLTAQTEHQEAQEKNIYTGKVRCLLLFIPPKDIHTIPAPSATRLLKVRTLHAVIFLERKKC